MSVKKKVVVFVGLLLYFILVMPFVPYIYNTVMGLMQSLNVTTVNVPIQEYNVTAQTWTPRVVQVDLTGVLGIIITFILFIVPILVLIIAIIH